MEDTNESTVAPFGELVTTPEGRATLAAATIPSIRRHADVSGLARRVMRRFSNQTLFQGEDRRQTLPIVKLTSTIPVEGFTGNPVQLDLFQRAFNQARVEITDAEDGFLLQLAAASAQAMASNPEATTGIMPRAITRDARILSAALRDLNAAEKTVAFIVMNPCDYHELVLKRKAEYYPGLRLETERRLLKTGIVAHYFWTTIIQTSKVGRGVVYAFAALDGMDEEGKDPRFSLVFSERESLTASCVDVDGVPTIVLEEEIGLGVSSHYVQRITIAPAEDEKAQS